MQRTYRSATMAFLLTATLLLNACGTKSQARTKAPTGTTQTTSQTSTSQTKSQTSPADSDCDALDKTSFEVEAALMGVEMGTDMGSMMIADSLDRAQKAIAKVTALKPKDPKVRAIKTKYLRLVEVAIAPVGPIAKPGNETALKAIAADVKTKIKVANDFRKDTIFFGDCK